MSDFDSRTPQNSSSLNNDFINKLFISRSILPFNTHDLIDSLLGASQFEVRMYRYKPIGLGMAVKRFPIQKKKRMRRWDNTNKYTDKLIKEAKILSQLKHSNNIVEFYGLCFDHDYALLCIELMHMNLSELNGIIRKIDIACPAYILEHIVVPIIDGLEYCHRKNIIHGDIKPDNILFNRRCETKVGDFSEPRVMGETIIGDTILYWPPERVRSTEVKDRKYDIWSLGMTLLEIICGFHPYEKLLGLNHDPTTLMQFIENIDPETLLQSAMQKMDENKRYSISYTEIYADELKLISRCLKRVDERATINELKNIPYYKIAQEECRRYEPLLKDKFDIYEKMNKILFEENFRKLYALIVEENRRYNLFYSELKFRLLLYSNKKRKREMHICYHANADKWIILKSYFKDNMTYLINELKFLHKFAGQPFIPQFYGWVSIEHNMMSSYSICFEVMDINLREFYSQFIKNFGYEAFKYALSEGILGYISCVVLNALSEIRIKGFALHNISLNNILLNDRGAVKLCGFTCASEYEEDIHVYSDVWCYAATLIEFACEDQPSYIKELDEVYPRKCIFPEEEIELKEMSKNFFSMRYSHQPHEFFMECLKQQFVSNFDALMKMDFYQQALKNIEENKAHLAMCVQAIIIAETRDTVPARWFHKFMDRENAKIYNTSNRSPVMAHFSVPNAGRRLYAQILKVDPEHEENLKVELEHEEYLKVDPDLEENLKESITIVSEIDDIFQKISKMKGKRTRFEKFIPLFGELFTLFYYLKKVDINKKSYPEFKKHTETVKQNDEQIALYLEHFKELIENSNGEGEEIEANDFKMIRNGIKCFNDSFEISSQNKELVSEIDEAIITWSHYYGYENLFGIKPENV